MTVGVPLVGGKVDGGNYFAFTMIWWPPVQSGWMGEMSIRTAAVGVGRGLWAAYPLRLWVAYPLCHAPANGFIFCVILPLLF
ncbi:MAG TPA: hypothetical protein VK818_22825 [Methylomirabilota bacterium]|nr:hypothetical protein [Methylomirabilota bacterium]